MGADETIFLAAPDRNSLDEWKIALRNIIEISKTKP